MNDYVTCYSEYFVDHTRLMEWTQTNGEACLAQRTVLCPIIGTNLVRSWVVIYVFICALAILLINLISSARDLSGLLRWLSTPSLVSVSVYCFHEPIDCGVWERRGRNKRQSNDSVFLCMTIVYSTHFRSLPPLPHDLVKGVRSIIRSTAIPISFKLYFKQGMKDESRKLLSMSFRLFS